MIHCLSKAMFRIPIYQIFSNNINRDNIKLISSSDRYIISCINSKDRNYLVVNTYAPNDNKDKLYFFNHIASAIRKVFINRSDHSLIWAGDFNTVHDFIVQTLINIVCSVRSSVCLSTTHKSLHKNNGNVCITMTFF